MLDENAPAPSLVEDVLATTTYDGITLHPLYSADLITEPPGPAGYPGSAPFVRGSRPQGGVAEGWEVRQRHEH
ncbi:methylmalonyl-CoA mutase family protein, partial [Saccharopolyspora sp. TS4A08]